MEVKQVKHVAFIMDGNGRWAEKRGQKRITGHKYGAMTLKRIVKKLTLSGIGYASFFAFSTENFARSKSEVKGIFDIVKEYFERNLSLYRQSGIKVKFIGDKSILDKSVQDFISATEQATKSGDKLTLIIALAYGGKDEIIRGINALMQSTQERTITEQALRECLDTSEIPDPDIIIRTGGEKRLSNFYLFQASYSELFFTDTLWPDFSVKELNCILKEYQKRTRKYGGVE